MGIPTDAMTALNTIVLLLIVPGIVWLLGRTGWTGDRKRAVILAAAGLLGIIQAIISGLIVLPDAWVQAIVAGLTVFAVVLVMSQAWYKLLEGKLPDEKAKRALTVEGELG